MSSEQLAAQVAGMKAVLVSLESQLQQRTAEAHLLSAALASLVAEQKQEREVTAEVIAEIAALECQEGDWTVLKARREAATSAELQGAASAASEKVVLHASNILIFRQLLAASSCTYCVLLAFVQ